MSGYIRLSSKGKEVQFHKSSNRSKQANVNGSTYIFDDSYDIDDTYNGPSFEMRQRRELPESTDKECLYVKKKLLEGDSLQNLSLKYDCPVCFVLTLK